MSDGVGAHNFTYDALDRLTAATHPNQTNESYTFEDVGNRTASHQGSSYSYQAFNRLVAANGSSFSYDSNGNLISKSDATGNWIYHWDYENRLLGTANASAARTTMSYRAMDGLRWELDEGDAAGERRMLWDRLGTSGYTDLLAEWNDTGVVRNYYRGALLAALTEASGRKQYHSDYLGTAQALTSGAGAVTDTYDYDAWGNLVAQSGTTSNTRSRCASRSCTPGHP